MLAITGLVVLAISVPLPFASNEAGCNDHCADAARWYVWNPMHNFGAPLLWIGIPACVYLWQRRKGQSAVLATLVSLCGWLGLFVLYAWGPPIVEETALYGGPELDVLPTRWVAGAGWSLLWFGALSSSPVANSPQPTHTS